ncbi:MAG: GNAT family N-acetyltransferase [Sphingomonadales bacterium]|nr:GNAT family N-acetyltransferase [Sphingomonadales bacterium]
MAAPLASPPLPDAADAAPRAVEGRVRALAWQAFEAPNARAAWDALAERCAEPNPFFESWYLLPSLRALDPRHEARMLRFHRNGELAGLMPLVRERRYYGWPFPHLRNWVHANCFLGTPLVARGDEDAFWRALFAWTDANAGLGLFLHLGAMPLDGPLHAALVQVLAEQGRESGVVLREERAMLASSLGQKDYFEAAVSAKKRKELRRQFTRLSELGEITVTREDDEAGLKPWIDEFLALEFSGWKGAAGSALASHQATSELFREAMAGAAARGRLERLALRLDGDPVAMLASFLTPPGAYSFKTAFDERFARFSPGVLLQRENLAVLERTGIDWTDSCAAADHPMIEHLWRERRPVGRISIAIGGNMRRRLFHQLLKAELGRKPAGIAS